LQSKIALKQTIVVSVLTIGAMIFGIVSVYQTGNYNKNNGDLLQLRWTIQEAQSKAGSAPVVVSAFRYYEAHYYQTDEHPMYYQEADKVPWGSFDMMRASDYRKVQNVATFAQEHGGVICLGKYIRDAERKNLSFSGAGTGNNHDRAFNRSYRLFLGGIKVM
jgi:hypothetical protein